MSPTLWGAPLERSRQRVAAILKQQLDSMASQIQPDTTRKKQMESALRKPWPLSAAT